MFWWLVHLSTGALSGGLYANSEQANLLTSQVKVTRCQRLFVLIPGYSKHFQYVLTMTRRTKERRTERNFFSNTC